MELQLHAWSAGDAPRLAALAAHPSLQPEFDSLLGGGIARLLGDAYIPPECRLLATVDGDDAGFGYAYVLPTGAGPFAAFRMGVVDRFRRRGAGLALHAALRESVATIAPAIHDLEIAAIVPNPAAAGFAARHGYAPSRIYWTMHRPGPDLPVPEWPAGVAPRRFDGSPADMERWVTTFNASWLEQHRPILSTMEDLRRHLVGGRLDPQGMFFAEREGRPLGFVRCALEATRGDIAVLGVMPEARGLGLGRALLRHGVRWLVERRAPSVTLQVDGENERALRLYRQEGFEILRTRQLWSRLD